MEQRDVRGGREWLAALAGILLLFFVVLAGALGPWGVWALGYFAVFALVGAAGVLLASRHNRFAEVAGQTIASMAGAALAYVPAVVAATLIFENGTQGYDTPNVGFVLWFWASYTGPVVITLAVLIVTARYFRRSVLVTTVAGGMLLAVAALPALLLLSVAAVCGQGIEYLGSGSCPVR